MITRSTRHTLKACNATKASRYQAFVEESSRVSLHALDAVWRHYVEIGELHIPKLLDYKKFAPADSKLSARAAQCAVNAAGGVVRSAIEKQRRVVWVRDNVANSSPKDKKFKKPEPKFISAQLNANCATFQASEGRFLGFLKLSSLGKEFGTIWVPIVKNPRVAGDLKSGFLLSKRNVQLVWEREAPENTGSEVIAVDQGLIDVATCSDGQTTPKQCPHGYDLPSVLDKLSRKKKGSKAFRRAQAHRKNFVNWSINQLNLKGVKEVRLEKVVNIRFGRSSSRKMSHWCNPEIRDKLKSRCEELNVSVVEQMCAYRSQRCNECGNVRKANRKGKLYSCRNCGYECDADLNAARNHLGDLPAVPKSFLGRRLNLGDGFFWKESGFFTFDGAELVSPALQQLPSSSQN